MVKFGMEGVFEFFIGYMSCMLRRGRESLDGGRISGEGMKGILSRLVCVISGCWKAVARGSSNVACVERVGVTDRSRGARSPLIVLFAVVGSRGVG